MEATCDEFGGAYHHRKSLPDNKDEYSGSTRISSDTITLSFTKEFPYPNRRLSKRSTGAPSRKYEAKISPGFVEMQAPTMFS
jgi:hypothetical protein